MLVRTGRDSGVGSSRAIVWALNAFVLSPLPVTFGKERASHPLWGHKDYSPALLRKKRNYQLVAGGGAGVHVRSEEGWLPLTQRGQDVMDPRRGVSLFSSPTRPTRS